MTQVLIRYRVKPEHADENARLVRDVYAELSATEPGGLRYATLRLEDGGTFVHVLLSAGDGDPLNGLDAFRRFRAGLDERLESGPERSEVEVVGAYGFD